MSDPAEIPGKCNRPKRQGGGLCKRPAGAGTSHPGSGPCSKHGGSWPKVAQHHEELLARQDAEESVTRLGLTLDEFRNGERIDPREALTQELLRTARNVRALEVLVGERGTDLYGELYHADGSLTGRALPHVLYVMLLEERKHYVNVAAAAARAGVEERRVQIEQEKGQMIAAVIRATVDAIKGLTAQQRQQALEAAARSLRELPSGGAA